jgi:hypothetical protein
VEHPVASTALVFWFFTALIGLYMTGVAVDFGRPVGESANTHWPTWLMAWHPLTATVFVTMWLVYLNTFDPLLGWLSFGLLIVVAALGDVLLVTWIKDRRAERKATDTYVPEVRNYVPAHHQGVVQQDAPDRVPVTSLTERRIPTIAVYSHGFTASVTILLVLLSCLGVGR